jgi:23S rRNA (uracil1939-C5)-methyltransferase
MQPGDVVTLTIEKPVAGGRMLARDGGQVVLVWAAIPGELVRARIDRVSAHTAYATAIDVLDASPDRREAHDWRCGGSAYAHIDYTKQPALKASIVCDAFQRLARVTLDAPPHVEPSPERGYRMRARLHSDGSRLGFLREGTREICDPGVTGQLLDTTTDVLRRLESQLGSARVEVESVYVSENMSGSLRAVHLDLPQSRPRPDLRLFDAAAIAQSISVSSAGEETIPLVGEPYVVEELALEFASVRLRRHTRAFFQGNRYLLRTLVARVVSQVPARDDVLDLYAGGGLFSTPLAARGDVRVTAVEGDRFAGDDLRWNGRLYGKTIRTYRRAVESYLRDRPTFAGTVIVDPPRTGLSKEASEQIAATGARRVVYVSCDVATLARDVGVFLRAGYAMTHVEAFDLFPNTAHVETLVVLDRARRGDCQV